MGRTGVLRQQHVLGGRNPWGERGGLVSGFWFFDIAGVLSKYRAIDEPTGIMVSGLWFLLRKRGWRRAALPCTFVAHGVRQAAAIPSGNAVAANMAALCIGRRPAGPLLVMPKP